MSGGAGGPSSSAEMAIDPAPQASEIPAVCAPDYGREIETLRVLLTMSNPRKFKKSDDFHRLMDALCNEGNKGIEKTLLYIGYLTFDFQTCPDDDFVMLGKLDRRK